MMSLYVAKAGPMIYIANDNQLLIILQIKVFRISYLPEPTIKFIDMYGSEDRILQLL